VVFNKADLADDTQRLLLRSLAPHAIFVSARTGEGIDELRAAIAELLPQPSIEVDLLVPYDRGDVISALHDHATILTTTYEPEGTRVAALVTEEQAPGLLAFAAQTPAAR